MGGSEMNGVSRFGGLTPRAERVQAWRAGGLKGSLGSRLALSGLQSKV